MAETTAARPEPFWFGDPRPGCFGMLHRPGQANGRGVVICNGLGFEGSLAHRPFRHLADRLTERGFTVLRFDYPGTGDAAGGPWETGRLEAWVAGVGQAVDLLRSRESVTDVQLVGFRMGATLALLHADEHPGLSGLALWAPVQVGKSYARELSALARLSGAHRPVQRVTADWFPEDSLEAVGFEFTADTLAELKSVDVRAARATAPASAVLVLDRDDAPESAELIGSLEAAGSKVEHDTFGGYLDFITDDETTSVIPTAALDRLESWLESTTPVDFQSPPRSVAVSDRLLVEDAHEGHMFAPGATAESCIESPVWIAGRCFGIVDRPLDETPLARKVVLILNTGSMRCSGPGGLHVVLGRHWASVGMTVVRVDLGGAGDSLSPDPAAENKPYDPSRLQDVADIVSWIRRELPCDELSLIGICSGAYNAFRGAVEGAQVDRVMPVNQLIFSLGGLDVRGSNDAAVVSAGRLSRALGNRDRWKRLMKGEESVAEAVGRLRGLMGEGAASGLRQMATAAGRNIAGKVGLGRQSAPDLARELIELDQRGVEVVMIFAAEEVGLRYVRLMGGSTVDALVAAGRVKIIEIDGGDHVFSPPGARQRLIEAATEVLVGETDPLRTAGHSPTKDMLRGS